MGTIALVGGTGAVGRAIARVLSDRGRTCRVIGRNGASLEKLFGGSGAELRTWNADAESARAALEGVESAIYLVGLPYDRFELHPRLMRATLEGGLAAGVRRMLLIGTVYPYGLHERELWTKPIRANLVPSTLECERSKRTSCSQPTATALTRWCFACPIFMDRAWKRVT